VLALTSLPAFVPQVISCAASDAQDVVLKKSLYLYITTWATANPELMLLTIAANCTCHGVKTVHIDLVTVSLQRTLR
jgi:hypothetical protein